MKKFYKKSLHNSGDHKVYCQMAPVSMLKGLWLPVKLCVFAKVCLLFESHRALLISVKYYNMFLHDLLCSFHGKKNSDSTFIFDNNSKQGLENRFQARLC